MKKHYLLFFLDDFHKGSVNHVIHFIGFTTLGFGLGKPSWLAIFLSPLIMETGHLYNYLRGIHREHAVKIIPLQLAAGFVFTLVAYLITHYLFK